MATPLSKCDEGDEKFDMKTVVDCVTEIHQECVRSFLDNLKLDFDEARELRKAESWIEWAQRLKYLKLCTVDIPDFILPKHCSGQLIDVKVFSKGGPDDHIYDTYQNVREKVARGNCFLKITHGPNQCSRCILYALKKFTGGLGDDDDKNRGDNFTWKKYFTKSLDCAKKIVATRKANGEAAHLSCVKIDGQYLLCAGSKNVHMLIRNRADIAFYKGDRYRIAAEVCHSIMDCLEAMRPEHKERLIQFLTTTRFTAVFEILSPSHQHVEDLSYLERSTLQFITWTMTDLEPSSDQSLCTVPPHIGIEIARALGLETITYETIPATDVQARMKQIRQGYQYEGEVLFFLDETDNVIGLLKKKTVWYIICRAIREKSRNFVRQFTKDPHKYSSVKDTTKMEKRLKEIQTWLSLSDETIEAWKVIAISFMEWLLVVLKDGEKSAEDFYDRFPVLWKEHLEARNLTDNLPMESTETEEVFDSEGASASGQS